MEQRNGRIDRKLQPQPEVYCHYFVYKQRPEDRILRVLVRKTETIQQELGSLSQVIDARLAKVAEPRHRREIDSLESEIESADLDADQKAAIEDELEAPASGSSTARADRPAADAAGELAQEHRPDEPISARPSPARLELLGAEPLKPVEDEDGIRHASSFPHSTNGRAPTRPGPTRWTRCGCPAKRDQKLWEWRRTSPIRAVVFEDPGTSTTTSSTCTWSNAWFSGCSAVSRAQGSCITTCRGPAWPRRPTAIPRVILLGRLCLYGDGAARLHEELIPVTARWSIPRSARARCPRTPRTPKRRRWPCSKTRCSRRKAFQLTPEVISATSASRARRHPANCCRTWRRAARNTPRRREETAARGEAEAKAMREILETQQKHIIATEKLARQTWTPQQLRLDFGDDEDELLAARCQQTLLGQSGSGGNSRGTEDGAGSNSRNCTRSRPGGSNRSVWSISGR